MQSKRQSLIETVCNTAIGFIGSFLITAVCITYILDKWIASIVITVLCTVWSIARGYVLRRMFNNGTFQNIWYYVLALRIRRRRMKEMQKQDLQFHSCCCGDNHTEDTCSTFSDANQSQSSLTSSSTKQSTSS